MDDTIFVNLDVDYHLLVPNIMSKKKILRKLIINDYKKEYLRVKDYTDAQRDIAIGQAKTRLIEWFCENMEEVAAEECQKAEFSKLCRVMGSVLYFDSYGTLSFVPSRVKKNSDYFRLFEEKEGALNVKKQSSRLQEIFANDAGTEIPLLSLWYTPHLTEILAVRSGFKYDTVANQQRNCLPRKSQSNRILIHHG